MATYVVTIAGVDHDLLLEGIDIRLAVNGIDTLLARVESVGGSPYYRPDIDDEVILLEDGVPVIGGFITATREMGYGGPNLGQIVTEIAVSGYAEITQRQHITYTVSSGSPAPTLKDVLTDLVTTYWAADGMTLSGSQVDGPSVPAMDFLDAVGKDILDKLSQATGYVWRVDATNTLRMWNPGDLVAPFAIDADDLPAKYFGDIETQKTRLDGYANRVIVVGETITELDRVETYVSDGIQTVYPMTYDVTGTRAGVVIVSNVPSLGVQAGDFIYEAIGLAPVVSPSPFVWEIDPDANTFTRLDGPLPAGAIQSFTFDGQLTVRAQADALTGHQPPIRDLVVRAPIRTQADADAIAEAILEDVKDASQVRAAYTTRETAALFPGQVQTFDVPERELFGSFLLTDVSIRRDPDNLALMREVTCNRGHVIKGDYRDLWAKMIAGVGPGNIGAGDGFGSTGPIVTSATSGPGTGSAFRVPGEDTQIFFNEKGALGARPGARWLYEDSDSFLLGTPGTATVTNTGVGAYAATSRTYQIQFLTVTGGRIVAASELGAGVGFTPNGTSLAARVSRPAAPGAATHWIVWGNSVNISGLVAVGSTFYDDSVNPGSYSGAAPLAPGDYIRRAQMLVTALSTAPAESVFQARTTDTGGSVKGTIGIDPYDETYQEIFFGCEYVKGQYIARSTTAVFLYQSSDNVFFECYLNQTPGALLDVTRVYSLVFRCDGSSAAGIADATFESTDSLRSRFHSDDFVLASANGRTNGKCILAIVDNITGGPGTPKQLGIRLGDTTRTIRFDGVGSNVTFT